MILVDTNVLLDLYKSDPVWMPWSLRQLRAARTAPGLAVNVVVVAELTGHPADPTDVDGFLDALEITMTDIPRPAAQLAGLAFREYRQRGGAKTGVLPDFFIGAHAVSMGWALLTRDAGRYRTYFPDIDLICP